MKRNFLITCTNLETKSVKNKSLIKLIIAAIFFSKFKKQESDRFEIQKSKNTTGRNMYNDEVL